MAKPDTTFRSSLTGGCVSSRSLCCHDSVAYRCAQGLILRHTATVLSILAFPGFLLSTSPSPQVHIFMDPLQHTLSCLRILELEKQLLQPFIMPIYTKEIYLFPTTTPLSSQILSTGNHLVSSQRSSTPTRHQTSQPLAPTFRWKIRP